MERRGVSHIALIDEAEVLLAARAHEACDEHDLAADLRASLHELPQVRPERPLLTSLAGVALGIKQIELPNRNAVVHMLSMIEN